MEMYNQIAQNRQSYNHSHGTTLIDLAIIDLLPATDIIHGMSNR